MSSPVSLAAIEIAAQDLANQTVLTIEQARDKVINMVSFEDIAERERRARLNTTCWYREQTERMRRHMGVT